MLAPPCKRPAATKLSPKAPALSACPARAPAGLSAGLDFSRISIHPPLLQRKLIVGRTNDPLEYEADRVAEQVLRAPDGQFSVTPSSVQASCKCSACEDEDERLQRKGSGADGADGTVVPAAVHPVLRSPGRPLDAASRSFFETRFGQDFSGVRVHADAPAMASAREMQARAYTVGSDIVFGSGQYAPGTASGQRLLAHELTHVVQQGSGGAPKLLRQPLFEGSNLNLQAPQPRSLQNSVDASSATEADLELEVKLIQQWLAAHPEPTPQRAYLTAELTRLQVAADKRDSPLAFRFVSAWSAAAEAKRSKVFQEDKAYGGGSITRGLMQIDAVAPSVEEVWRQGLAEGIFGPDEKKPVDDWSQAKIDESFADRHSAARYGIVYGNSRYDNDSGRYSSDDRETWTRGVAYGLLFPEDKAAVMHVPVAEIARATSLSQRIKSVDPKSADAAKLIHEIHDFSNSKGVILLGPEVEKLLGPYGYKYTGSVEWAEVGHDIDLAFDKSPDPYKKNYPVNDRWDEANRQKGRGLNNLEGAQYDPDYFRSEAEFYQELIRRLNEFRTRYKHCGHSGPKDLDCQDAVAKEYFPQGQARQDAIRRWAYDDMQIANEALEGGVISGAGFTFAHEVLGWSTKRSAALGGALSTVGGLTALHMERQAVLNSTPSIAPAPPPPTTEVVAKDEPAQTPDHPFVQTPKAPAKPVVAVAPPPSKGVVVDVTDPRLPRVGKVANATDEITLRAQQAAQPKPVTPQRQTPAQEVPLQATGTGDVAPAKVVDTHDPAPSQGAGGTRMGDKPPGKTSATSGHVTVGNAAPANDKAPPATRRRQVVAAAAPAPASRKPPPTPERVAQVRQAVRRVANLPKDKRIIVSVWSKVTVDGDAAAGLKHPEFISFGADTDRVPGGGRAATLPNVANPSSTPAKAGTFQPVGGIIAEPAPNAHSVELYGYNTRAPVKGTNVSHAERQQIEFLESQSDEWLVRVKSIDAIVIGRDICDRCDIDIVHLQSRIDDLRTSKGLPPVVFNWVRGDGSK